MLSKISKRIVARTVFNKPSYGFRSLFDASANQSLHQKLARSDPSVPLEGHEPVIIENQDANIKVTTLKNGIRVVTEVTPFPNLIDMGILIDVGTRDETRQTSGALSSIRNTYFQYTLESDENKNYNLLQQSGSDFLCEYDQESTYYKLNCLAHDVVSVFDMMADTAFSLYTPERAEIGMMRNQQILEAEEQQPEAANFNDKILTTAYGLQGLGMPSAGLKENLMNLNHNTINQFMQKNYTPDRIFVCGAGVENHEEFAQLVESKINSLDWNWNRPTPREASRYKGGDMRVQTDEEMVTLALLFETVEWTHADMVAFNVLNTILGQSSSFSTGGPGKGMWARTTKRMMNRYYFVESVNSVNLHFNDTGLFGLNVMGPAGEGANLLRMITTELKDLTNRIPDQELQRAKNILKSHILMAMERQQDRVEEAVKNIKTFGQIQIEQYCERVQEITSEDINRIVATFLKKQPTFVVQGGDIKNIPSYDRIQNQIRI